MGPEMVLALMKRTLITVLLVAGPLLLAGLVIGISVSVMQAVTQIREMTLTFIPKILGVGAVLAICSPWMMKVIVDFTNHVFALMVQVAR